MIEVEVRLYTMLRKYSPGAAIGQPVILQMPGGACLSDLLVTLGVPESETKVALVNNSRQGEDYELADGDRVALFPPVAGG